MKSDKDRIKEAVRELLPAEMPVHQRARQLGSRDEVCTHADCGIVLLAHHLEVLCPFRQECPMTICQELSVTPSISRPKRRSRDDLGHHRPMPSRRRR